MSVNYSSGSYYPDKSLLESQLKPTEGGTREIATNKVKGGVNLIWGHAYSDLTRLDTLEVEGTPIYKNGGIPPQGDDIDGAKKTKYVFEQMAEKLDSTSLANRAANLFQQDLGGGVLKGVAKQKGLIKGEMTDTVVESTHTVTAKQKFNSIRTSGKEFKMIHEEFVEVRPMENIEKVTYFKVKTVVTGKITALETSDTSEMKIKTAYTKEHASKSEAYRDTYFGTRAGGFSDTETYIKG